MRRKSARAAARPTSRSRSRSPSSSRRSTAFSGLGRVPDGTPSVFPLPVRGEREEGRGSSGAKFGFDRREFPLGALGVERLGGLSRRERRVGPAQRRAGKD